MFTVPIDLLFSAARYILYGLLLLMPITLLAGSRLIKLLRRQATDVSSLLLTLRLFVAIILLAVLLHVVTITGHISLTCERQPTLVCQRERTLLYGLLQQETTLNALNPFQSPKTFRAQDEYPYRLMLQGVDQSYLLHPAHTFSRLEQVIDDRNRLLTIEDALADMRSFQLGKAGTTRYYRDRVGIAGTLMTVIQVVAIIPLVLALWLFAETRFGNLGSPRRH
jgi:hypothetical protein